MNDSITMIRFVAAVLRVYESLDSVLVGFSEMEDATPERVREELAPLIANAKEQFRGMKASIGMILGGDGGGVH